MVIIAVFIRHKGLFIHVMRRGQEIPDWFKIDPIHLFLVPR